MLYQRGHIISVSRLLDGLNIWVYFMLVMSHMVCESAARNFLIHSLKVGDVGCAVFGRFARLDEERDVGGAGEVSRVMSRTWITFAATGDPNGPGRECIGPHLISTFAENHVQMPPSSIPVPSWPKYGNGHDILQIRGSNMTIVRDDFREEAIRWIGRDEAWNLLTER